MPRAVVIFLAVITICFMGGVMSATAAPTSDTVEGVTIELDAEAQQEMESIVEDANEVLPGVDPKMNVGLLLTDDDVWVVTADTPLVTGATTASGDAFRAGSIPGVEYNVLFAETVDTEMEGKPVSVDDIEGNPEEYDRQLIRLTGEYSQLAYTLELGEGEFVQQETFAVMNAPQTDTEPLPPGQAGRWATLNLSDSDHGDSVEKELQSRLGATPELLFRDYGTTRFWMETEAHVDVVVDTGGDVTTLYVADVTPVSSTASIRDVASGNHDEEIVTVEADAATLSMSTKHTLLQVAQCAPDSVSNPVTGCLPVISDAVIHGGVLYDGIPDGPEEMVVFAGVSNSEQDVAIDASHERVKLTGEVVDGSEIAPEFAGLRVIVVYDIDGINSNSGGPPATVEEQRETLQESMTQQMNSSDEQNEERYSSTSSTSEEDSEQSSAQDSSDTNEDGSAAFSLSNFEAPNEHSGVITIAVRVRNEGDAAGEFDIAVQADGGSTSRSQLKTVFLEPDQEKRVEITVDGLDDESVYDVYVHSTHVGTVEPGESILERVGHLAEYQPWIGGVSALVGFSGIITTILIGGLVWLKKRRGRVPNTSEDELNRLANISTILFVGGILLALVSAWTLLIIGIVGIVVIGGFKALYEVV